MYIVFYRAPANKIRTYIGEYKTPEDALRRIEQGVATGCNLESYELYKTEKVEFHSVTKLEIK